MTFVRIRKFLIVLCAFVMCLCGGVALQLTSVSASALVYLEVRAGDFNLVYNGYSEYTYNFIATYNVENSTKLPQKLGYSYTLPENPFFYVQNSEKCVMVKRIYSRGNDTDMGIEFDATAGNDYIGFTDEITSFTIPKNFTMEAHSKYEGVYGGIKFVEDMTFVKGENNTWTPVIPDGEVEKPTATLDGQQAYAISLTGAILAPVWNSTQKTLSVQIELPYKTTETLVYTGTLGYSIDGANYSGEITLTQQENTSVLCYEFQNAESLSIGSGITITLFDTLLTNDKLGSLELKGSVTYYGYYGCEWTENRFYEVLETVGGVTTSHRLPLTQTEYALPVIDETTGNIKLGWAYNDELYKSGQSIPLSADKYVYNLKAITINYTLLDGASIRYSQNGDSGIRFTAVLQQQGYNEVERFIGGIGAILMPADCLKEGKEFTYQNYQGEDMGNVQQAFAFKNTVDFKTEGQFKLYTSLVRIKTQNFNRTYCSRAFVTALYKSGLEYVYTDNISSRSVYEVATIALNTDKENPKLQPWQKSILENYINGVANISYDPATLKAQVVSVCDNPAIKSVQVRISANGTIYLDLHTSVTNFLAVTYNGKRVKSPGQTYQNGVLTISFNESALSV